jgi:carbamoyltransferase
VQQVATYLSAGSTDHEHFERRANVAASFQVMLERCLCYAADYLWQKTRLDALRLAGGVALNCVATGVLLAKTPFSHLFMPRAPGDAGLVLGCSAFGPAYSDAETRAALARPDITWEQRPDIVTVCADLLQQGAIIGWCEGWSEFGPRALGHRSILADRSLHRYWGSSSTSTSLRWTPVASWNSRCRCSQAQRGLLYSAEQIDGTVRLQTVTASAHPRYYALIGEPLRHPRSAQYVI